MKNKRNNKSTIWLVLAALLIAVSMCLVIWIASHDDTTTTGEPYGVSGNEVLICKKMDYVYPFFNEQFVNPGDFSITISYEGEVIKSIFLKYSITYGDNYSADVGENRNHTMMYNHFGEDSLDESQFSVNYSVVKNVLNFTMYVDAQNLTRAARKYFLISDFDSFNSDKIINSYTNQEFDCRKQ